MKSGICQEIRSIKTGCLLLKVILLIFTTLEICTLHCILKLSQGYRLFLGLTHALEVQRLKKSLLLYRLTKMMIFRKILWWCFKNALLRMMTRKTKTFLQMQELTIAIFIKALLIAKKTSKWWSKNW